MHGVVVNELGSWLRGNEGYYRYCSLETIVDLSRVVGSRCTQIIHLVLHDLSESGLFVATVCAEAVAGRSVLANIGIRTEGSARDVILAVVRIEPRDAA